MLAMERGVEMTHIGELVDRIESSLNELSRTMGNPETLDFPALRPHMERLEQAVGLKSFIDAAYAYAADRARAGRFVGAAHTSEYLVRALGLSHSEARSRLQRGEELFAPPEPAPMPAPAPAPGETEEQRRAREEETGRIRAEEAARKRREEEAQRKARDEARKARSAEKHRMISRELEHLNEHSDPTHRELLAAALAEAPKRDLADLRTWLRARIRDANRRGRRPDGSRDPFAALKKRKIIIGPPDADGGARATLYLDGAGLAILKAALAPGRRPGSNTPVPPEEDRRPLAARQVDQLMSILRGYLDGDSKKARHGVGSVVVSLTAEELDRLTADDRLPTNTGDLLSPADVLRLGAARYDLGVLHDTDGRILDLGRTSRSASVFQKLALFAQELCCTRPGCQCGLIHADIHHIRAWMAGGRTDIENLTIQCRPHHSANNDNRDGADGLGHMDKDPPGGRTGWRPPDGGPLEFNETEFQRQSAGAKIRRRRPPGPGRDVA